MRTGFLTFAFLCAGCTQLAQQDTLHDMQAELASMQAAIGETQQQLTALTTSTADDAAAAAALDENFASLDQALNELHDTVRQQCKQPSPKPRPACEPTGPPVVMTKDDKMLLGEVERVWVDPPGLSVEARIDTGASSSSLHGDNITRFERDGEDWVRFDINQDDEVTTLELPVVKFARVYQQADKSGSRRPVVELRLYLGNVKDTFEFTLADRSHLEQGMILGRNFLTDIALVDVSRKFVQPRYKPPQQ